MTGLRQALQIGKIELWAYIIRKCSGGFSLLFRKSSK